MHFQVQYKKYLGNLCPHQNKKMWKRKTGEMTQVIKGLRASANKNQVRCYVVLAVPALKKQR